MKTVVPGDFSQITRSIALLIDGENIPPDFAGRILMNAGPRHELRVKRVYGNAVGIPGWEKAPGFRLIHTGTGKNSADMMLTIQAVELALAGEITDFVIASSDGDFSHLAHFLREKGLQVTGIGEVKAPDNFRKACTSFVELSKPPAPTIQPPPCSFDQKVAQIINLNSNGRGLKLTDLSVKMNTQFQVQISTMPEKTWRKYLTDRPEIYRVDARGPEACVHLIPAK